MHTRICRITVISLNWFLITVKPTAMKVYGADGCQITTEAAAEILAKIEELDIFDDVKTIDFEAGVANGNFRKKLDTLQRLAI